MSAQGNLCKSPGFSNMRNLRSNALFFVDYAYD